VKVNLTKTIQKQSRQDTITEYTHSRGGYIRVSPDAQPLDSPYLFARVGNPKFYCEDEAGYVYSFTGLVNGTSNAPKYMKALARAVERDLKEGS